MKNVATLLMTDVETVPIIEFGSEINIENAVIMAGWGIQSIEDIEYKRGFDGINVRDLNDMFEVGTLIICKPYRYCPDLMKIMNFIVRNRESIKEVICYWNEMESEIIAFCKHYSIELKKIQVGLEQQEAHNSTLYQFRIPIVFVVSTNEFSDKFCVQMSLYNHFSGLGYRSKLIGSKEYSELFGVCNFPQFMFNKNFTNAEKIIKFNHYVKKIEDDYQPDVIIIGIPGAIDGFINGLSVYFDDIAYLVSKAVKPDSTVVSILYNDIKTSNCLKNNIFYKYGWDLDCIYINNRMLDLQLSQAYKKCQYIKIQRKTIEKKLLNLLNDKEHKYFIYNSINELCSLIQDKLVNYGEENIV